jgi:hypothetical protein
MELAYYGPAARVLLAQLKDEEIGKILERITFYL